MCSFIQTCPEGGDILIEKDIADACNISAILADLAYCGECFILTDAGCVSWYGIPNFYIYAYNIHRKLNSEC